MAPKNDKTTRPIASVPRQRGRNPGRLLGSLLAATLLPLVLAPQAARSAPIGLDAIYAFGDSFVEVGNHFLLTTDRPQGPVPPPPYFAGRFANGPIWIERVAQRAGLTLKPSEAGFDPDADRAVSFGYGGAGTGQGNLSPAQVPVPGVLAQVARFRGALSAAGRAADPDALYVLWAGANDYFLNVTSGPAETVGNLRIAVEDLAEAGARRFLVATLPDMGKTPLAVALGVTDLFTGLTLAHNQLLSATLSGLETARPDLDIATLDVFALFEEILADPAAFGFSGGLAPGPAAGCIFPPFVCTPVVGETRSFYWDEVHPTAAVHRLIAAEALDVLAVSEPPGLALVGAGLLALVLQRRRAAVPTP